MRSIYIVNIVLEIVPSCSGTILTMDTIAKDVKYAPRLSLILLENGKWDTHKIEIFL